MRPRILWCGEASFLNTGYAVYQREVLSRLFNTGQFDIAELASYCSPADDRISTVPWRVYPVLPHPKDERAKQSYNHNGIDQFGAAIFEAVCNDFRPTHVVDIRDPWVFTYQEMSPYRPYFKHCIMPTVDSSPQNEKWISSFISADHVFTYQDWSLGVLKREGGGRINLAGAAPPCASPDFKPLDPQHISSIKQNLGLPNGCKVIGTVMRNQRRKLFPDLFRSFRNFLDMSGRKDVILYCHTSYPDMGWDLPKYLNECGIMSYVYFTYVCAKCGAITANTFKDAVQTCEACNHPTSGMSNVQKGVSDKTLAAIYNTFDLYVQYSNSEGFGMPQVEAAACGVPIAGTDFSAMTDIVRKLGGYPIPTLYLYDELETGCKRAIPDNEDFSEFLVRFLEGKTSLCREETRRLYLKHYNWDTTASKWAKIFSLGKCEDLWSGPSRKHSPAQIDKAISSLSNSDFVKFLIANVYGEPTKLGTHFEAQLLKDLNYGIAGGSYGSYFFNDMAMVFEKPSFESFDRQKATNLMVALCEKKNFWEDRRMEKNASNQ